MRLRQTLAVISLASFTGALPAHAVNGISLELGSSDSSNASVDIVRVGLQWNWKSRWSVGADWQLGGYWELNLGYWENDSPFRTNSGLTDIGFTPVFRLQPSNLSGASPYVELGIGMHLLSKSSVGRERRFGSMFQFGDHIGVGVRFGPKGAYDLGYRFQHLSNASIKAPNQGINFHQVRLQYHF